MTLTAKQYETFKQIQALRDEIFKKVQFEIEGFHEYLTLVDDFDHTGNADERLEKELNHLKSIIEKI